MEYWSGGVRAEKLIPENPQKLLKTLEMLVGFGF